MIFNMQHSNLRPDLNEWHIAARCGSLETIQLLSEQDIEQQLFINNKAGWWPINLAKDAPTANLLKKVMEKSHTIDNHIISAGLWNNAESVQTQYGYELQSFLLQSGFSQKIATQGSIEPSMNSRFNLAKFWIAIADIHNILPNSNYTEFNHPINLAIACCNVFFIQAAIDVWGSNIKDYIHQDAIGSYYMKKDYAFKMQKILKYQLNIHIDIANSVAHEAHRFSIHANALDALEGY